MKYKGLMQMFHFDSLPRASVYALLGAVYALGCSGNIDSSPVEPEPDVSVPTPTPTQEEPAPDPIIDEEPEEPPAKALLQAQIEDILNRTCGECHGANGRREAGMNYI